MDTQVKLIVGLGNPGLQYRQTKHNIGFQAIDTLYEECSRTLALKNAPLPSQTAICRSIVTEVVWKDCPIILAKPMTYMNSSGVAVAALLQQFHLVPAELCVVYDDIHLDLGTIRIRRNGSDGGQKGMKSIIQHLGTNAFPRLRIGIGPAIGRLDRYVLTAFSADEEIEMAHALDRAVDAISTLLTADIGAAMNRFNRR